jgi:hypothetical protein
MDIAGLANLLHEPRNITMGSKSLIHRITGGTGTAYMHARQLGSTPEEACASAGRHRERILNAVSS